MSAQAAMFAFQVVGNIFAAKKQRQLVQAQRIVDRANADAENMNRDSNRNVSAATSALSNYARSLNNKRMSEAAGAKLDAIRTNALRVMDNMTTGGVSQQLQAHEQAGAISAMAAAAGVGGGSLDMVKRTMHLRNSVQKQQVANLEAQQRADFAASQNAAIGELAGAVDVATTVASMDYGISQPAIRGAGPGTASALLNVDWTLARDAAHSIGDWFNKPSSNAITADLGSGFGPSTFGNTGTGFDLGSGLGKTNTDYFNG